MTTHTVASPNPARKKGPAGQSLLDRLRGLATPLHLHFAGVAVLALLNLYLLVHLGLAWEAKHSGSAEAQAQQMVLLRAAEIAATPLEGLDTKLAEASAEADQFYATRLPETDSEMLGELGALTRKQGVRLSRGQYAHGAVLPGTAGELTEMRMDASLSGDYRPLVQLINSLERDRMFFVIYGVSLTGQQSGTVNLRLRLTTYLRGRVTVDLPVAAGDSAPASTAAANGGTGR